MADITSKSKLEIGLAILAVSMVGAAAVTYDRVNRLDSLNIGTQLALINANLRSINLKLGLPIDQRAVNAEIEASHTAVQRLLRPE